MAVTINFIRDDNAEFLIDDSKWKILEDGLDGFDSVDVDIKTSDKAKGDGSDITGEQVGSKDRTIEALLTDTRYNNQYREEARSFFQYKHIYKCQINYNGIEKECEGVLYAFSLPTTNIFYNLEMKIVLLCGDAYLYGKEKQTPITIGSNTINFEGDVTPLCDFIYIGAYESINLEINGYNLIINANSIDGDEIKISFTRDGIRIYKNDELNMGLLDFASDLDIELSLNNNISSDVAGTLIYREAYTGL